MTNDALNRASLPSNVWACADRYETALELVVLKKALNGGFLEDAADIALPSAVVAGQPVLRLSRRTRRNRCQRIQITAFVIAGRIAAASGT
jgi:hypothetical protein